MTLLLQGTDIRKTYHLGRKRIDVLQGVCVDIAPGESVAVVGASGAGKSTLLHVLGALDAPDAGRVTVGGVDVYGVSAARRARMRATTMGFVFQSYCLLPEMTVLENVLLPARALGGRVPDREARARAASLLDEVGLAERAEHMPMELSGGEQQRAAVARALMNRPPIILADEPTGNLDGETGRRIMECLFGLVKREGRSMILVTHNEVTALNCDRAYRLVGGVLQPVVPQA